MQRTSAVKPGRQSWPHAKLIEHIRRGEWARRFGSSPRRIEVRRAFCCQRNIEAERADLHFSKNPAGWFRPRLPPATKATAFSFRLASAASLGSAVPVDGENANRTPSSSESGLISYDNRVIRSPADRSVPLSETTTRFIPTRSQTALIFLQKEWTI